jgi:hypothetical protein
MRSWVVVVMASYLSCGLLAPQPVGPYLAHAVRYGSHKLHVTCIELGARYWD